MFKREKPFLEIVLMGSIINGLHKVSGNPYHQVKVTGEIVHNLKEKDGIPRLKDLKKLGLTVANYKELAQFCNEVGTTIGGKSPKAALVNAEAYVEAVSRIPTDGFVELGGRVLLGVSPVGKTT